MTGLSLQITYRNGRQTAAYLYLPREPGDRASRSVEPVQGIVVDYAADDRPIGIEIRSPGHVRIEQVQQVLEELGLGRASDSELAPLEAA